MRLSELMQGLPVLWAQGDAEITGITVDSRTVRPGDLFVAIVGRTHDGHQFIEDAIARGAVAVVAQGSPHSLTPSPTTQERAAQLEPSPPTHLPRRGRGESAPPSPTRWERGAGGVRALYLVPNTRDALWRIAQRFYGDPSREMLVVGITGTNGKTTTTHMLQKILVAWGKPTLIVGTLGAWIEYPDGTRLTLAQEGEFTTPEVYQLQALLKTAREQGAEAVVMEVSSHALDQKRADGVHFDAGVFTNLTQDHLDYHGTMDAYAAAKLRLFTDLAEQSAKPFKAIINIDDEWGRRFAARAKGAVYTYGQSECALVQATRVEYGLEGLRFTLHSPCLNSRLTGSESFPSGNKSFPSGNEPCQSGNNSFPTENKSFPVGNEPCQTGNKSFPIGNEPCPSENESFSIGNEPCATGNKSFSDALTPSPSPAARERGDSSPLAHAVGEGGYQLYIPLPAPYNLNNALAAAATALALGAPMDAIQRGLASLEQVAGRFQRAPIDAEYQVIVDFAHTPDALQRVLQAGRMLNPTRLTVLFGCGGDRDAVKRPLMGKIAAELADRVILTSDNPRTEDPHAILEQILAGIPDALRHKVALVEADRRRAIEYALHTAQAGELILLAGKGHEPYQIIGTEKLPFSDIETAKEVARAKR
ncbi:MAG: UDP-N-acetylmuramoyl-L-alanyl-D-glutamate--2,6-diaminopimelate ligase [Fimbriimonadales bacterium]|nr:UDP-N-acetylmuramoyl-L-alanyl-D-glutamate--2,6-diaminopimelate ligase [Fimbriimonadales bacterium]